MTNAGSYVAHNRKESGDGRAAAAETVLVFGGLEGSRERGKNEPLQYLDRRGEKRDRAIRNALVRRFPRLRGGGRSRLRF